MYTATLQIVPTINNVLKSEICHLCVVILLGLGAMGEIDKLSHKTRGFIATHQYNYVNIVLNVSFALSFLKMLSNLGKPKCVFQCYCCYTAPHLEEICFHVAFQGVPSYIVMLFTCFVSNTKIFQVIESRFIS